MSRLPRSRSRLDLPVSGSEPVYDERDGRWFGRRANRLHGAYSWALQDNEEGRQEVALPGDIAHELQELPGLDEKPVVTCRDLAVQVLADNPGLVTCVPAGERCPQGQHKLMAFIQPPSRPPPLGTPYMVPHHFYVQHKDVWIQMRRGDRVADVARCGVGRVLGVGAASFVYVCVWRRG